MLLSVFGKYIFLQSLGWGVVNSLWQAGLLWMLYKLVTTANKHLSALFKHHLSLLLLFLSVTWFAITTVQNYLLIQHEADIAVSGWLYLSKKLDAALQWLSVAYLGLLLLHSVHFIKHVSNLYFIRNGQLLKAPVDTRIFTEQTALHIGIRKKVTIWLSENVEVPSVIGLLKPIILLPVAALNHLTTEQAESIILHELAHIKRNDYAINLLQSFIELVLFFNPFAKLLGHAARKEREHCCDDWVLNYRYNKHDYAAALLMLEQQRTQPVHLALAATNGKKNLLGRIKRLFVAEPATSINFSQQIKLAFAGMVLLAGMFFLFPVVKRAAAVEQTAAKSEAIFPSVIPEKTTPGNYTELEADQTTNTPSTTSASATLKKEIDNKRPGKVEEVEYSTALINEELLQPNQSPKNIPVQAADKETTSYPQLLVQVEEEQSGVKEKNTYFLQLKNRNGYAEIKPLLILNKKMKPLRVKQQSAGKPVVADSIKISSGKRVTS